MWVLGYTLRASDLIQRRGRKPTTVEGVASRSIADAGFKRSLLLSIGSRVLCTLGDEP